MPIRLPNSLEADGNNAASGGADGLETKTEDSFAEAGGTVEVGATEGTKTDVLLVNSLLCSGTLCGTGDEVAAVGSVAGEDIRPFATNELRRFESGFGFPPTLFGCSVGHTREEGGGPGGSGGNTVPMRGVVTAGVLPWEVRSIAEDGVIKDADVVKSWIGGGPLGSGGCILAFGNPLDRLLDRSPLFMIAANKLLVVDLSELSTGLFG